MTWVENILIICGVSLDIFAGMECQGALLAKIEKKDLCIICGVIALWQMASLYIGISCARLLYGRTPFANQEIFIGEVIAAIIFFCLGIRLMLKGIKNEGITERREELGVKKTVSMAAATCIYTLLAGAAFGFAGANLSVIMIMIFIVSVIVVVLGMYTGYHFGFEQKRIAYLAGAVLLWSAGVDVVLHHILNLF